MPSPKRYENNRFVRQPDHPNHLKRAIHHDYHRPARYMITLRKSDSLPNLSTIHGSVANPQIELTTHGKCFEKALSLWAEQYAQIRIMSYVVMPDHIHLCLSVQSYLKNGLSLAIAGLMGKATSQAKLTLDCNLPVAQTDMRYFSKGFNDRIAYSEDQWQRQLAYVKDNPRRYLIKRLYPDFYLRRWKLSVGGKDYVAIGNIFLLKNPEMRVVRFSRRYKPGEFEQKRAAWHETVRNCGVLVSPFIHPKEKEVRDYALDNGGSIVRICVNGFAERFSPSGKEFEIMMSQRLLLIGQFVYNSRKENLSYAQAKALNGIAEEIAAIDWRSEDGHIRPLEPK